MGRGLSDLQRSILQIGARNLAEEGARERGSGSDVYLPEIIAEVYALGDRRQARRALGRQVFPNTPEVRRARAAVCRALDRLKRRGLIRRTYGAWGSWRGANLTEAGRLSVSTRENCHNVNR